MKLYKRSEFLMLPSGTIYSKINEDSGELMNGLFCKTSDSLDYENDWVEQNLISEHGFPNGIKDGLDAFYHVIELRDSGKEFETDLNCAGRDGFYNGDEEKFVVWNISDIKKLMNFLNRAIEKAP